MRAMPTPSADDGPRFHSNMPISELTERVTRVIEASVVSLAPLVAETTDGATITKTSQPSTGPLLSAGARGKLDSQGDRMRSHRMMAQILGRMYMQKLRITFLKQETLSPARFAILSSIFSDTRPQQWQGVGPHLGADKSIST